MSTPTVDYDALAAQHGGAPQIDYDALAAQHGGTVASGGSAPAADSRNVVQRFMDDLTTVKPAEEAIPSWMPDAVGHALNQMQKFGAGAIQAATAPLVHPEQTLSSMGNAIAHPINTGVNMVKSAIANPAQTAGNLVGGAVLGEAAAPVVQLAAKIPSKTLLLGRTPEGAYESALKPSTTLSEGERANLVQAGLQNSIPVSKGGLQTIGDLIDDYNTKIKAVIDADPTRQISPIPALKNLQSVRAKFANQVTPTADVNDVDAVGQEFANRFNNGSVGPVPQGTMNASDAQAMKQGTYQALGSKAYGEVKGASIEAQKALARGLKDEIATQFPEINNLNAGLGKLLDLQPVIERAVNRTANHQLIGIGTPIAASAAKAVTGSGSVGVIAGLTKAVLDDPFVKSRLAIALSKGAQIPIGQASARVEAYSAALGSASGAAGASSGGQTEGK